MPTYARPDPLAGYDAGANDFARNMLAELPGMRETAAARYAKPAAPADPAAPPPPPPVDPATLSNADVVALYDALATRPDVKLDIASASRLQELVNGLR